MRKKVLATILLVLLFMTCGCKAKTDEKSTDFYVTNEPVYAIPTKYCELYYPEKWKEQIKVHIDEENPYTVSFSASIDENEVPLFDLIFDGNQGFKLGTLNSENQKIDVYIINYEFNREEYEEDDYITLCGMCDDVNVIISKLIESMKFEIES